MKKTKKETSCKEIHARQKTYRCHFELTLDVIGGKWKPVIIYNLGVEGTLRFSELFRLISGVSERMLIKQLRELEEDNLIHREVYQVVPPKVEYSLSATGKTLIPLMNSLYLWGREYYEALEK